jgi:hypothetical protein
VFFRSNLKNGPFKGQNAWKEEGKAQKLLFRAAAEAQGGISQKEDNQGVGILKIIARNAANSFFCQI